MVIGISPWRLKASGQLASIEVCFFSIPKQSMLKLRTVKGVTSIQSLSRNAKKRSSKQHEVNWISVQFTLFNNRTIDITLFHACKNSKQASSSASVRLKTTFIRKQNPLYSWFQSLCKSWMFLRTSFTTAFFCFCWFHPLYSLLRHWSTFSAKFGILGCKSNCSQFHKFCWSGHLILTQLTWCGFRLSRSDIG